MKRRDPGLPGELFAYKYSSPVYPASCWLTANDRRHTHEKKSHGVLLPRQIVVIASYKKSKISAPANQ